jgi:hypothetical protein
MAALGTRRERFESANELQCFAGIAPVKEASGNSVWIHFRRACPKFVRLLDSAVRMGSNLLRRPERKGQQTPRRRARPGVQVDAHTLPLLETASTLPRRGLPRRVAKRILPARQLTAAVQMPEKILDFTTSGIFRPVSPGA